MPVSVAPRGGWPETEGTTVRKVRRVNDSRLWSFTPTRQARRLPPHACERGGDPGLTMPVTNRTMTT
jgi:hypothetical protein